MSWAVTHTTDWSAIANMAAVAAGATLVDGWIEKRGNVWNVNAGKLQGTSNDPNGWQQNFLLRPTSENLISSMITTEIPAGNLSLPFNGLILRWQNATNFYLFEAHNALIEIYTVVGGTASVITSSAVAGYNAAHRYKLEASVTGSSPTVVTLILYDLDNSNSIVASCTVSNSAAALQPAGQSGHVMWSQATASQVAFGTKTETLTSVTTLTAGTLTVSSSSPSGIVIAYSGSAGGLNPTTDLYRDTTVNFTPGAGNKIATNASFPYTDAVPGPNEYYYKVVTHDATSTATSQVLLGSLWYAPVVLGIVGDSIMTDNDSLGDTVPTEIVKCIKKLGIQRNITVGSNRAQGGTYTANWMPGQTAYNNSLTAFAAAGVQYISMMIGVNDAANQNVSAATYASNIAAIAAGYISNGYKVILHYPSYASPYVLTLTEANVERLRSYRAALDALNYNNTTFFKGDTNSWSYFAEHLNELVDGLHPNLVGMASLGLLQAMAIQNVLIPPASGSGLKAFAF